MVGSSKKQALIIAGMLTLSAIIFFSFIKKDEITSQKISFTEVKQVESSKFSLVGITATSGERVLVAFDEYNHNSKMGVIKTLNQNDFWDPVTCASMPNIFASNRYLIVKDSKRINGDIQNNIYFYDYEINTLKVSSVIADMVGDVYQEDDSFVFFVKSGDSVIQKHIYSYDLLSQKVVSIKIDEDINPLTTKVTKANSTYNIRTFDGSKYIDYTLRDGGFVKTESSDYNMGSDHVDIKPAKNMVNRILKQTEDFVILQSYSISNMYDYTLSIMNRSNKIINAFYDNQNVKNNFYIVGVVKNN